jgi:hypothetical protein
VREEVIDHHRNPHNYELQDLCAFSKERDHSEDLGVDVRMILK